VLYDSSARESGRWSERAADLLVGAAIAFVAVIVAAAYVANGALDPDDSTRAVVLRNEGARPVGVRIYGLGTRSASYELPARFEVQFMPPFCRVRLLTFVDGACHETGLMGFGGGEDRWSDLAMLIPRGNGAVGVLEPDELDEWRQTHEPLPAAQAVPVTGCAEV
jgi:hypothetical protein